MRLAAAAAAAGTVAWLIRCSQRRPLLLGAKTSQEEREKFRPVLAEVARKFFFVCMDIAGVAKTVRIRIEENKVDITDEKLREQLVRQCKVFERLAEIQSEVSSQHGISTEDLQELQQTHAGDEGIRGYVQGLNSMLDAALGGTMPIMPNVKIPAALGEDKVLKILSEAHGLETKKVLERVGGTKMSVKDLGEVLNVAHRDAWDETMKAHAEKMRPGGPEVYHSTLALYMRGDAFAERRRKIDEVQKQRMLKIFRPPDAGLGSIPEGKAAG